MFLPEYAKQLFESSRMALDQLNTQLRWAYFDDSSRLVVRASYLDDGYVRARVDTATALDVNLLEILRELSWSFYNIAQIAVRADSLQNLDIPLSTRASESTLSAIKSKTDNLDVLLSTRASESTLSSFSGKFPSAVALSDSLSNPTTTIVGNAILGFDGTYWRRVRVDTSGRLAIQNQPNFDVALSTRASEATLSAIKNALASVGTDKIRASVVDSLPESPFNISKVGGTAITGRDWSNDFAKLQNLDVALSVLATLQRWGRNVSPVWVHGGEITAPPANTALVSKTVTSGKFGYIYGFFINAGEANDFRINWTSGSTSYSRRIVFPSKGSLQYVDFTAFNEGLPASGGTSITITNVNAGSSGVVYQAAILYAEV